MKIVNNHGSAVNNYNHTPGIQLKTMGYLIRFCCDSLGTINASLDSLHFTFKLIASIKMTIPSLDLSRIKNNQFSYLQPVK